MHKTLTGASFIAESRKRSTKALLKAVKKLSNQYLIKIQSFCEKSHLYSDYKKFWVVKNSKPIIGRLSQINTKQNAKLISTFAFSTLYTKLPHKDLAKVLFGDSKKKNWFFLNNAFWSNEPKTKSFFTKTFSKKLWNFQLKVHILQLVMSSCFNLLAVLWELTLVHFG